MKSRVPMLFGQRSGRCFPESVLAGSLLLVLLSMQFLGAREVVTFGPSGRTTWIGEVADDAIAAIEPEYRSPVDPNFSQVGYTLPRSTSDRPFVEPVIDFESADFPEGILPKRVGEGQNLAAEIQNRGGGITSPSSSAGAASGSARDKFERLLLQVISSEADVAGTGAAFERKAYPINGAHLILDLGSRVGVNAVRFFPRNTEFPNPLAPFQDDFLRNFDLRINDGVNLTAAGNPIWETYASVTDNPDRVAVVDIDPPRLIRFIRLQATSSIPFEIEKLQVFGEGYFPAARYYSPIIEIKTASAAWGQLRWEQETIGDPRQTRLEIRTRTGRDETPLSYYRKQVGRKDAPEFSESVQNPDEPLERDEYRRLSPRGEGRSDDEWERGSVRADLENWSPWSPPYRSEQGTSPTGARIVSPGPRRYFQVRVDFLTTDLESTHILRNLAFDFTTPALAGALVGEIFPRRVSPATDVSFVYALRTEMDGEGLQGFDGLELFTGAPVSRLERIEILYRDSDKNIDHVFEIQDGPTTDGAEGEPKITLFTARGFAVSFPHIRESGTVIKLHFVARALAYSSVFDGRAILRAEDAFQSAVSGNADSLHAADISTESGATVLSPSVAGENLIANLALGSPAVTPNGDLVNDGLDLEFEVLQVVGTSVIAVEVFDLSGRRVRRLLELDDQNGLYNSDLFPELAWDGTDEQGGVVPPGLYLIRVAVHGDSRSSEVLRTIAVAY